MQPDLRAVPEEGAANLREQQAVEHWVIGNKGVDKECMVCYSHFDLDEVQPVAGCANSFAHTMCRHCSGKVIRYSSRETPPSCPRCRGKWDFSSPQASAVWSLLQAEQEPPQKRLKVLKD